MNTSNIRDNIISRFFIKTNNQTGSLESNKILRYFMSPNDKKYSKYSNIKEYIKNRYNEYDSYSEVIWRMYFHIEERPVCNVCGNRIKFLGYYNNTVNFATTCCHKCSSTFSAAKVKATKIERGNLGKNNIKKGKQTCLERYGDENYRNIEKYKETISSRTQEEKDLISEKLKQAWLNKTQEEKDLIFEKSKQTCLERYGVEYSWQSENNKEKSKKTRLEKYGDENYNNREKAKQTFLERYGDENYRNGEKAKETWATKSKEEKRKMKELEFSTKEERYGSYNYNNREQFKQTCLEKYGVENYALLPEAKEHTSKVGRSKEVKDKKRATRKKNHTEKTSKVEERLKNLLLEKFPDLITQYNSERYPFDCDFYIPSLDLFIEYNGCQFHNFRPFDKTNPEHLQEIEYFKKRSEELKLESNKKTNQYDNIIYDWTIRDVNKREIAKANNLNYIELWNEKEAIEFINKL